MRKVFLFLSILLISQVVLFSSTLSSARGRNGMVVSAHRLASEVGVEILKKGGNAIDAAVAVGFTLAVVFPEAGNIGGGGFMLIREQDGTATVIDFRETAPKAVWRDMYLDSTGEVTDKAVRGHLSAGVPGTVAGIIKALESFGSMKLPEVIDPAIHYAEEGFVVDHNLENNLKEYEKDLIKYPSTVKIFFKDGKRYVEGDTLRQPDLASTLRRIKEKGADDFYSGETAQSIVREMKEGGGLITSDDLKNYYPIVREPIRGSYQCIDFERLCFSSVQ
ncbi:MAG: gamma-glutamyltransferase [Ignavibacteriales bacterium]|nr:gamma-glutamyltransferase [Ignavibacteriales bacterium]